MHILYGVQGTGNGHISRASAMFEAFRRHPDIRITWLLSGRDRNKGCGVIPDFEWREGITFVTANGKVRMLQTLRRNNLLNFVRDVRSLDLSPYDAVICDFEPVIAHAARRRGVHVTGIGHQYAFEHKIPMEGTNPVVNGIMQMFAPVDLGIGLHWHHFDAPILPPIIDLELPEQMPALIPEKVIVYLPFENLQAIEELLREFSNFEFYIYHPDAQDRDEANLHVRAISRTGFKRDLLDCTHVMSNSGFELISECLHIGKRILTKPLHGQMEQLSNAAALGKLGYAHVIRRLERQAVGDWLTGDSAPVRVIYPDVAAELARWIAGGQQESREWLTARLWGETTADSELAGIPTPAG